MKSVHSETMKEEEIKEYFMSVVNSNILDNSSLIYLRIQCHYLLHD